MLSRQLVQRALSGRTAPPSAREPNRGGAGRSTGGEDAAHQVPGADAVTTRFQQREGPRTPVQSNGFRIPGVCVDLLAGVRIRVALRNQS